MRPNSTWPASSSTDCARRVALRVEVARLTATGAVLSPAARRAEWRPAPRAERPQRRTALRALRRPRPDGRARSSPSPLLPSRARNSSTRSGVAQPRSTTRSRVDIFLETSSSCSLMNHPMNCSPAKSAALMAATAARGRRTRPRPAVPRQRDGLAEARGHPRRRGAADDVLGPRPSRSRWRSSRSGASRTSAPTSCAWRARAATSPASSSCSGSSRSRSKRSPRCRRCCASSSAPATTRCASRSSSRARATAATAAREPGMPTAAGGAL